MCLGLNQKVVHCTTNGSRKEQLSRIGVIELDRLGAVFGVHHEFGFAFEVSRVFGVVTIKVTDVVGSFSVTVPAKIFLHRSVATTEEKQMK